jgi:hypothetical protein
MTLARREVVIKGETVDPALRSLVRRRMQEVLEPLRVRPVAAEVTFFDDDGPKGGRAWRCALTLRLPYRPPVRVERVELSPRLAFHAGYGILERQLARYREVDRDRRRRPKKYFIARRLAEAGARRPRARAAD